MGAQTEHAGIVGAVRRMVARLLQWRIVRAYLLYSEHRGPQLADSITYRALFSVFAGVLLGFSVVTLWLDGNPSAVRELDKALNSVIPGLSDIVDPAAIDAPTSFTLLGIVSLLGLVGAAISAISSLRSALHILADDLIEGGSFFGGLLRNLLVAIVFGGLVVTAAGLSFYGSVGIAAASSQLGLSSGGNVVAFFTWLLGLMIVFAIDTVAIMVVFRVLSGVKAPRRAVWKGAMLGGIGLTLLQILSGLFVRGATSNPLLASFAALIALLIWFNLSAQVVLLASSYIITAAKEAEDRVRELGASTLAQRRRLRAEELVAAARRELREAREAERGEGGAGKD